MQFTQPTYFGQQPYPFNTPFQFNSYPEIVGEGNVTSVVTPDGNTQLLFLPTQWWKPNQAPMVGQCDFNPYFNNIGAWFVRSIINPFQPNVFNQSYPISCGSNYYQRGSNSNYNVDYPPYQLKFHNDACTSSSDLQYFYPKQHNWYRKPQGYAAVQVDVPIVPMVTDVYREVVVCSKPCNCTIGPRNENNEAKQCNTKKKCTQPTVSDQSMNTCTASTTQISKKESKKSNSKKMSQTRDFINKSVSTYTDQETATNASDRGTQSGSRRVPIRILSVCGDIRTGNTTELWIPNSPQAKKAMKSKSSVSFKGVRESDSCSSSCSCNSETELDL